MFFLFPSHLILNFQYKNSTYSLLGKKILAGPVTYGENNSLNFKEKNSFISKFLKVHLCRFENLPISSFSYKNNMLKISY